MAHGVIAPKGFIQKKKKKLPQRKNCHWNPFFFEELSLKIVAVFATIEPSINMCAISGLSKFLFNKNISNGVIFLS